MAAGIPLNRSVPAVASPAGALSSPGCAEMIVTWIASLGAGLVPVPLAMKAVASSCWPH